MYAYWSIDHLIDAISGVNRRTPSLRIAFHAQKLLSVLLHSVGKGRSSVLEKLR